jgi:hypothetical protein
VFWEIWSEAPPWWALAIYGERWCSRVDWWHLDGSKATAFLTSGPSNSKSRIQDRGIDLKKQKEQWDILKSSRFEVHLGTLDRFRRVYSEHAIFFIRCCVALHLTFLEVGFVVLPCISPFYSTSLLNQLNKQN